VHEVAAYRTIANTEALSEGKHMLSSREVELVVFTSSSTVTRVAMALNDQRGAMNEGLVACIGPRTAAAAAKVGLRADIVARRHTIPGLVEAMEEYYLKAQNRTDGAN